MSAYTTDDEYMGGAHGDTDYRPYNVGIMKSRPGLLRLGDLFRPGQDARSICAQLIVAKLRGNPRAESIRDGSVNSRTLAKGPLKFAITPTGLLFLFSPYELGSYAAGSFLVKIPFSDLRGTLKPNGPLAPLLRPAAGHRHDALSHALRAGEPGVPSARFISQ